MADLLIRIRGAGLEILDLELVRRSEMTEIDEDDNRSTSLTFDLGGTP